MAKTPSLKASVRLVFTAPSFLRCSSFCPRSKAYTTDEATTATSA